MLRLETNIEGKLAHFGYLRDHIEAHGFTIGGDWEYDRGYFDYVMWRDSDETIYLRAPFVVTEGELDMYDTHIRFLKPFVIKHVVHVGLDYEESSLLDATGFSQFQSPVDKDAPIENKNKWVEAGEKVITDRLLPYVH